jgi:GntR family transcriptional regulator
MSPRAEEVLPKYVQIANHIREQILRGDLKPGDEIPSERRIVEEWGVARPTATRALSALRVEGLVEARQGAGTFVRSRPQLSRRARDRYARSRTTGRIYTSQERAEILEAGLAPVTEAVAAALSLEPGTLAARRRRRVLDDDGPVEVSTSWFTAETASRAPRLLERERIIEGTLVYIETSTGRSGRAATDRVTARLATPQEADELQLGGGPAAVLVVHHVLYDAAGQPLEFAEAVLPQGRWSFSEDYEVAT